MDTKAAQVIEHYVLAFEGKPTGFAKSVSGGNIKGEVATHQLGPDNVQKKHLATIKHEGITLEVGMGIGRVMFDWINSAFTQGHSTRTGEIVAADFDYNVMRITEFHNAHITEIGFPALDGSSKDPCYMTVKIEPERLRHRKPQGRQLKPRTDSTQWLASNFRFELGDLPCKRVSKIDAFTIKQGVVDDQVGGDRQKIEVPNLKLTFSAADAEPWEAWFKSFVVDGQSSDADELSGSITFLSPDHQSALGTIEIINAGIISLQPAKTEANKEDLSRIVVEMYVEEMKIDFKEVDA